jgi:endonuclease YncB( thermonuclease family)
LANRDPDIEKIVDEYTEANKVKSPHATAFDSFLEQLRKDRAELKEVSPGKLISNVRTFEEANALSKFWAEEYGSDYVPQWELSKTKNQLATYPSQYPGDRFALPISPRDIEGERKVERNLLGLFTREQMLGKAPVNLVPKGLNYNSFLSQQAPVTGRWFSFDLETTGLLKDLSSLDHGSRVQVLSLGIAGSDRSRISALQNLPENTSGLGKVIKNVILPKHKAALEQISGWQDIGDGLLSDPRRRKIGAFAVAGASERDIVSNFIQSARVARESGSAILGYNIRKFDLPFLQSVAKMRGYGSEELDELLRTTRVVDVSDYAKAFLSEKLGSEYVGWQADTIDHISPRGWKLEDLAYAFGHKAGASSAAHTADVDADATAYIFKMLTKRDKKGRLLAEKIWENGGKQRYLEAQKRRGTSPVPLSDLGKYLRGDRLDLPDQMRPRDLPLSLAERVGITTTEEGAAEKVTKVVEKTAKSYTASDFFTAKNMKVAAIGLGIVGMLGLAFSAKDDNYNTIEALKHGGMAEGTRRQFSDFGSGAISKKVVRTAAERISDAIGTVYISGPMSGLPGLNKRAFREAEKEFNRLGIRVVNPARANPKDKSWKGFMKEDLEQMEAHADSIFFLPGWKASSTTSWKGSPGANIERRRAKKLGLLNLNARIPGGDDAYNTIPALRHGGLAEIIRKIYTSFGSGYQGLPEYLMGVPIDDDIREYRKNVIDAGKYSKVKEELDRREQESAKSLGNFERGDFKTKDTLIPDYIKGINYRNPRLREVDLSNFKVQVEDADTLVLKRSGLRGLFSKDITVRLAGIDAPETASHKGDPLEDIRIWQDQPQGEESAKKLEALIKSQKNLQLLVSQEMSYGRYIGAVIGDRSLINVEAARQGLASALPFGKVEEDIISRGVIRQAENEAQEKEAGIWGLARYKAIDIVQKTVGQPITYNTLTRVDKLAQNLNLAAYGSFLQGLGSGKRELSESEKRTAEKLGYVLRQTHGGRKRAFNKMDGLHPGTDSSMGTEKVRQFSDFGSGLKELFERVSNSISKKIISADTNRLENLYRESSLVSSISLFAREKYASARFSLFKRQASKKVTSDESIKKYIQLEEKYLNAKRERALYAYSQTSKDVDLSSVLSNEGKQLIEPLQAFSVTGNRNELIKNLEDLTGTKIISDEKELFEYIKEFKLNRSGLSADNLSKEQLSSLDNRARILTNEILFKDGERRSGQSASDLNLIYVSDRLNQNEQLPVIVHETIESLKNKRLKEATGLESPVDFYTSNLGHVTDQVPQDEMVLMSMFSPESLELEKYKRQMNEAYVGISIRDRSAAKRNEAMRTIETYHALVRGNKERGNIGSKFPGMPDDGFAASNREAHTDFKKKFASRWDKLRKYAMEIYSDLPEEEAVNALRNSQNFRSAIQNAMKGAGQEIGKGDQGIVPIRRFTAEFEEKGKKYQLPFAVKTFKGTAESAGFQARFQQKEIEGLRAMGHLDTAGYYGSEGNEVYMEAFDVVGELGNDTIDMETFGRLAETLEHGFSKGVTHTDLHGGNILKVLDDQGNNQHVIIDWGMSERFEKDSPFELPEYYFGDIHKKIKESFESNYGKAFDNRYQNISQYSHLSDMARLYSHMFDQDAVAIPKMFEMNGDPYIKNMAPIGEHGGINNILNYGNISFSKTYGGAITTAQGLSIDEAVDFWRQEFNESVDRTFTYGREALTESEKYRKKRIISNIGEDDIDNALNNFGPKQTSEGLLDLADLENEGITDLAVAQMAGLPTAAMEAFRNKSKASVGIGLRAAHKAGKGHY